MNLIFLVVASYSYSTDSYKESYEHILKLFFVRTATALRMCLAIKGKKLPPIIFHTCIYSYFQTCLG